MGKKHNSVDEGLADIGKVRRLIKLFDMNKVEPSPVATRVSKHFPETNGVHKSAPVERRFSPKRHTRHFSESDALWKQTLLKSAYEACKSPPSPILKSPTVKLFSSEHDQWEMEL